MNELENLFKECSDIIAQLKKNQKELETKFKVLQKMSHKVEPIKTTKKKTTKEELDK